MFHQSIKKAVKLASILLITISGIDTSFAQKLDTSKLIRVIEKELKKQGLLNAKFDLSVRSQNQSGGQTAFQITNNYGVNSHVIYGSNYGINGDVNFLTEKYALMSQLDPLGLQYKTYGLKFTSELNTLMSKVFREDPPNTYTVISSDEALENANRTIEKYRYFPFSYWAKAVILIQLGDPQWVNYAEKAREILLHTTNIAGHNDVHDSTLSVVEENLRQYYAKQRKH